MSFLTKVREFHKTFGVARRETPGFPVWDRVVLRMKLVTEEYTELMNAMGFDVEVAVTKELEDSSLFEFHIEEESHGANIVGVGDATSDLHYVVSGTSDEFGLPEDELFDEVHRSNMSKADEDGTVPRREDGKILKAARWSPPDINSILARHGAKF